MGGKGSKGGLQVRNVAERYMRTIEQNMNCVNQYLAYESAFGSTCGFCVRR
jgi:hypothetical protein